MIFILCFAISTVSAANTNVDEIAIAETSNIELESINEANLLSDNKNSVELSANTNNTIKENNMNNTAKNTEIYTNNGDSVLNNTKVTPIISVENVIIKNGENIIIPFNVTDNEGKYIPGGAIVTLSWENNIINQYVKLEKGQSFANFSAGLLIGKVSDGNCPIDFSKLLKDITNLFNKTSENSSNPIKISEKPNFDISKLFNITIPVSNITLPDYSNIFNITKPNITDIINNLNITKPNITDIFNKNNLNALTDISRFIKIISLLFEGNKGIICNYTFAPGTYNITIKYIGDENYTDAITDTGKLIIVSGQNITASDVVMYYKDGSRYIVNLTDYEGNPLPNKTVVITINGEKYTRTTNSNGSASIAINLGAGNYTVSASYGSDIVENTITILSTIEGNDIVKVFRNDTQYYATFFDNQGKALAEGTNAIFNINGIMYERKVNGNGTAKLNINLRPGEYIITATNPITGEMHSNKITVIPNIISSDLVKYYKNDSQYIVTLIGNDGKVVGAGETVTFNINGVFYERQTNASGQAKLNINLRPGEYIITGEYNGCQVSNNITVESILTATDLSKTTSESKAFETKLVDGQGKPLANETVTFNINGVLYNRITDINGIAKLNINLQKGEYIITSSYNSLNIANTVTVTE